MKAHLHATVCKPWNSNLSVRNASHVSAWHRSAQSQIMSGAKQCAYCMQFSADEVFWLYLSFWQSNWAPAPPSWLPLSCHAAHHGSLPIVLPPTSTQVLVFSYGPLMSSIPSDPHCYTRKFKDLGWIKNPYLLKNEWLQQQQPCPKDNCCGANQVRSHQFSFV